MRFEASLIVKVPRDKTYSCYTDFEAMPSWSSDKTKVRVSRREGNNVYLEKAPRAGTRQETRELKLFPPERVEYERETRFTRTRSVVKFEGVPEGTRVTASLEVELKGRWGWIFRTRGKTEAESSALEELNSFAKYVERIP
jgi:uncharacterized protein YndB with AHSA1/START domain